MGPNFEHDGGEPARAAGRRLPPICHFNVTSGVAITPAACRNHRAFLVSSTSLDRPPSVPAGH
jgi:hypothetical protein